MTVTVTTLATALGQPAPEPHSITDQQWKAWINDALMLIEHRAEQLDANYLDIDEVKLDYVVREAVTAHIKRPDDALQVSVQVDDGMTSKSYRSGSGRITILDEWWQLLGLTGSTGAFGIDMAPTPAHDPIREWLAATDRTW